MRHMGAGEPTFGCGYVCFLLGVVEQHHDLVLFNGIAFFHPNPFHDALETRADGDTFAVDDVAGDGEQFIGWTVGRRRWLGGGWFGCGFIGLCRRSLFWSGAFTFGLGVGIVAEDTMIAFRFWPGEIDSGGGGDYDDGEDRFYGPFRASLHRRIDLQLGEV